MSYQPPPAYNSAQNGFQVVQMPPETPLAVGNLVGYSNFPQSPNSEPKLTGPTSYPGNEFLTVIVWIYMIGKYITGLVIIFMFRMYNYYQIWQLLIFMFLVLNNWDFWMVRNRKKWLVFKPLNLSALFSNPYFYLFIVDEIFLIAFPRVCMAMHLNMFFILTAVECLAVLNAVFVCIFITFEIFEHNPMENNNRYIQTSKNFELSPQSPIRVVESSAFRIVLVVLSPEAYGHFYINRTTARFVNRSKKHEETCTLQFCIERPPPVGHTITLIPETHKLQGALQIKGYRSFGENKKSEVITAIHQFLPDGANVLCARLRVSYADINIS